MTKEELVELINSIDMKVVTGFVLNYRKEKPSIYSAYNEDTEEKTISFNRNLEETFKNQFDYLDSRISRTQETIEEVIKRDDERFEKLSKGVM